MSAEHFETVLSADARTAPDGRGIEWAEAFTGEPRWLNADGTINRPPGEQTWAAVKVYAHDALSIAADTVRAMPMEGLSDDLPEQREQAARIIEAARELVRDLACDDAFDGTWSAERWRQLLKAVRDAATDGAAW